MPDTHQSRSRRPTAAERADKAERQADFLEQRATAAERQRAAYDRTVAATERLKIATAGLDSQSLIMMHNQYRADEALEDAFFVLLTSLRVLHARPFEDAMRRVGYRVELVGNGEPA